MPFFNHLISHASFSSEHRVTTLPFQPTPLTVMLIGFEPGRGTAEHPGPPGAFCVVDGQGWMSIDSDF